MGQSQPYARGNPKCEDMPTDGMTNGTQKSAGEGLTDALEMRLPAKGEYLPVVRAAIGVIAGGMDFNYDEIVQLRVAISEAFELAVKRASLRSRSSASMEVAVRITVELDRLEIVIPKTRDMESRLSLDDEMESEALLKSLMDEVEIDGEAGTDALVRMIKYKTAVQT